MIEKITPDKPSGGWKLVVSPPQGAEDKDESPTKFIGTKERLEELQQLLFIIGPTEARVILTGETGTGKTSLARALHLAHPERAMKCFRRTNIGALVPDLAATQLFGHVKGAFTGALESAPGIIKESNGGTFFLDEVAAAAENVQVMLLTLLETNRLNPVGATEKTERPEIDARFFAATTLSLEDLRRSKSFRSDLYFRLAEYHLPLLPLRKMPEEIPLLAKAFLFDCQESLRTRPINGAPCGRLDAIEDAAMSRLELHSWPGNVRELQHVIRAAVVRSREDPGTHVLREKWLQFELGETAQPDVAFDGGLSWKEANEAFKARWVAWALSQHRTAAEICRRFGIDPKTAKKYAA
jgi:DNA-binding NtrC family response regulator